MGEICLNFVLANLSLLTLFDYVITLENHAFYFLLTNSKTIKAKQKFSSILASFQAFFRKGT